MSFREKSAWAMSGVMLVTGLFYAWLVGLAPSAPVIGPLLPYVLLVIVLSIVVQVSLALFSPTEANAPADEREQFVIAKAGHWSGIILGVAVVMSGAVYIWGPDGNMLFHHILGAMILAQLAEYLFQGVMFRRGI